MKRLIVLAALALMVLGSAAIASANVDVEAKGQFQFQANFMDNSDFRSAEDGGSNEDDLNFWFRARTEFRFIANENLMSELYVEYKDRIGGAGSGLDKDSTDRTLGVKRAFIQYRLPNTDVTTTAGIFSYNLPGAAAGNMVLADIDAGGLTVSSPITDNVGVAVGFTRLIDTTDDDGVSNLRDEFDLFYLSAPLSFDGIEATPYFAFATIGKDAFNGVFDGSKIDDAYLGLVAPSGAAYTDDATAWWAGSSFSMNMFDPIVVDADLVYGSIDADQDINDRAGWGMDLSVKYTGLDFMTPKFLFAYTSGEDDDATDGSERLPSVAKDWAMGSTYFGGSSLTSSDLESQNQFGFWTVGIELDNISFVENLSHDIIVMYVQGTNDKDLIRGTNSASFNNINNDGFFLTEEDYAITVDFNTKYQIYDNLAAIAEFGYVNMNLDEDTWKDYTNADKTDDMYKLALGLVYNF